MHRSIPMTASLLAALLASAGASAQPQQARPAGRVDLVRQTADSAVSLMRRGQLRRGGNAQVRTTMSAREKTAAVSAAGMPTPVFAATFRLSPATPVASNGRGYLNAWRATTLPHAPNYLEEVPVVAVYDRAGGTGNSFVSFTIATVAGTSYLVDCQTFAGTLFVTQGSTATGFVGNAPVTFVFQATETGTATFSMEGDGARNQGYWLFFGCDVTPTR